MLFNTKTIPVGCNQRTRSGKPIYIHMLKMIDQNAGLTDIYSTVLCVCSQLSVLPLLQFPARVYTVEIFEFDGRKTSVRACSLA